MTKNHRDLEKKLLSLAALATLIAISLVGCKNFMKSDDDVKETMQHEVDVANAPEVSVRVQPSSDSLGSVTPNGLVTFKVNVPSTVLASEVSGGFIKWAAFYSGDMATEVSDAVSFTNAKAKETPATLLVNRPDVVIQAMFEKRPQVTYYFPDPLNGDAYTNSPIRITFSKPIDPATLTSTVDGKAVSNITFTQYFAGITKDITSTNYGAGSLSTDGKVLVFKNTAEMGARSTMTVKVAKAVRDTSGLEMADDYSFNFKVGTSKDADPPVIGDIAAGLTDKYEFSASSESDRRITVSQGPIYVRLRGTDVGAGIVSATVTPTLSKYDDAGNLLGTVAYAARVIPWIDDAGTSTSFSVEDLTAGDSSDGLITLSVVLEDGNENKTNPPALYHFVRDTTPPSVVDPAQLSRITTSNVSGGSGGSGFYNKASTIYFSNVDPVVDVGFAGNATVPCLRSAKVQYRVSMNPGDFPTMPESNWVDAGKETSIPLSSYTGSDGSAVPIYVQLRDDLKNTSAVTQLRTVPVDNNPPTGCSVSITNSFALNGLKFVSGGSLAYAIKATDVISGVAKYCVKSENVTPAATEWKNCSSAADGTLTLTDSISVTDPNGQNAIYAWFQDGAGNAVSTAVTDMVICDNAIPTVSDFYLRERRKAAFSASTDSEKETQYSNDQSFYFMFIANDTASGFSTFTYSDDKGTTSDPIAMKSAASAGSGDYKVTNLNVAALASTGGIPKQVLVTGILTIPANNSEHTLTVKVKDGANNESLGLANNEAGTNRIIFDNMPPKLTGLSCDTGASGYFQDGTKLYTNLPKPTVNITGSDTGSGTVSGLMDALLSCSSGDWSVPKSVAFSRKDSVNPETVTATLSFGTSETAVISATPQDYAGNVGDASTITLIMDKTPPTLELYLFDQSLPTTSCVKGKQTALKDVGVPSLVVTPPASMKWSKFTIGMIGYDSGSGVKSGASHYYRLFKRTVSVADEEFTVNAGNQFLDPSTPTSISLPDGEYGTGNSATWLVSVQAKDNVGNEMKTGESIGFVYDVTPPTIYESTVKVTLSAAEDAPDISKIQTKMPASGMCPEGTYYFIPLSAVSGDAAQAVCVQIKATDCPADGDKNGSGLASVKDGLTSYPVNSTTGEVHDTTSFQSEADGPYVVIANGTSSKSWNFAGVALMRFQPTITDKCGNSAKVSAPFYVVLDDGLPTATPIFSKEGTGTTLGVKYISKTATLSFTPTDPETVSSTTYQRRASGVFGYVLSSSSMPPAVPTSGLGDWKAYTTGSGSVTISAKDLNDLIDPDPAHPDPINPHMKDLYLHLLDNAGNRNTISIGKVRIDSTPPGAFRASSGGHGQIDFRRRWRGKVCYVSEI